MSRGGEVLANPHLKNAVLIVLRGGDSPTNVWFTEEVDPVADFARAFGQPPSSTPRYVAISADSDDTGKTRGNFTFALTVVRSSSSHRPYRRFPQ